MNEIPSAAQFHRDHQHPRWYGEDGEIIVTSGKFTEKGALRKIRAVLRNEGEWPEDELPTEIGRTKIAWGEDPDGDDGWGYLFSYGGGDGLYDAWVWTA